MRSSHWGHFRSLISRSFRGHILLRMPQSSSCFELCCWLLQKPFCDSLLIVDQMWPSDGRQWFSKFSLLKNFKSKTFYSNRSHYCLSSTIVVPEMIDQHGVRDSPLKWPIQQWAPSLSSSNPWKAICSRWRTPKSKVNMKSTFGLTRMTQRRRISDLEPNYDEQNPNRRNRNKSNPNKRNHDKPNHRRQRRTAASRPWTAPKA